jgi:uncharacterized protein YraI
MKRTLLITFYLLSFQILLAQSVMYVNSSNGLNLREGPGTGYKTIANIPNGSRVDVISTQGDWVKVEYDGKEGYVSRQYINENKPRNNSSNNAERKSDNRSASSKNKSSVSASNERSWGLGLRLGDLSGLTGKKYLPGGKALEFSLGTTSYRGYDYEDHFYDNDRYADYEYLNYRRRGAVALQVHYLFQKDISGVNNLQWYWGFGGQLRSKSYLYEYRYRSYYGPGQGDYTWVTATDKVSDIDLGADILIGLEHHIPGAPLSVFTDINLMLELVDDPFVLFPQGGIGIRYNLK